MPTQPNQPSRLVSVLYGFLPLAIGAAALFVLVIIGGKAVQGYEMRQEARALEQRIDGLKRENRRMTQELEHLQSDEYIEKVAREELGLIREGDVAIIMIHPEGRASARALPVATPTPMATPAEQGIPTWQRWLSLFVSRD